MSKLRFCLIWPVLALCLLPTAQSSERAEALARAERALTGGDYAAGVAAYVEAANASDNLETAEQATRLVYEFGFDTETEAAAERWAALAQDNWRPWVYAGLAATRAGETRRAATHYRAALARAGDPEPLCRLVRDHLGNGARFDETADTWESVAKRAEEIPCVLTLAARAALSADRTEDAERWLQKLEALGELSNEARLIRIARLIADEEVDAAFTDPALRLSAAATTRELVELALLNARAEDEANAQALLEQLLSEQPDDPDVLEAIALLRLQAGELDTAREYLLTLLGSGNKTGDALYYLARFAEGERRVEQAIRMYAQVDDGDFVIAAQQRVADLILDREGLPAALDHLDGFVERNPRHGLNLSTVQAALYAQGEFYEQALALYDGFLAVRPRAEFAKLSRADVLLRSGDLDAAIEAFRETVRVYPESANALNALGYTLADRTRKFREAERLIDKALEKEPDNAAIIDSKGWVLFRRGKLTEAREQLERAYEMFPDPEVAAHLGEVLWRLGEREEARELLEQAYRRNPDDDVLVETIRRLMEEGPATRS